MITHDDVVVDSFPAGTLQANCILLYSNITHEAILVDPGDDADFIIKKINHLKLKVSTILLTHGHIDHAGVAGEISKQTGAKIFLHSGDLFLYDGLKQQALAFGLPVSTPAPLDGHLTDDLVFSLLTRNGASPLLKTLHTPGHSPGSCCFYSDFFPIPLLIAGDTIFAGSIGRTDLPGGSSKEIMNSIRKKILPLPENTHIITGHGPETDLKTEKRTNYFLSGLRSS
jgi:glyoxylase-like metal-dependent hydrolase (beta-lactamase superfamily II)